MSQEELDAIRQDYLSSLQELTFNSRIIISNLTVIAQENINAAQAITKAIEEHLIKCSPAYKLPALYLVDSICKNIGTPYTIFFGLNLFKTFTDTYMLVPEMVRKENVRAVSNLETADHEWKSIVCIGTNEKN